MNSDKDFKNKLDAVLGKIAPTGRDQVEALIELVIKAGGTSINALFEMVVNKNRSLSLRLDICWLLPRLRLQPTKTSMLLKDILKFDPSEQIREEAALSLGFFTGQNIVEALLNSLKKDSSELVRMATIHSLGIISSKHSASILISVVQDMNEDAEIRAMAAESLAHVIDERVVEVLINALQEDSPLIRYSSAYALGQQLDTKALAALKALASSDITTTKWGSIASCALNSIEIITNKHPT